jgi:acetyl esterase/lipase
VYVRVYEPRDRSALLPGILYIHGGGFVCGAPDEFDGFCDHLVEAVEAIVVSVDYRLAPEHPFPAGPEDAYAALKWLFASSTEFGVDTSRIAIVGSSAGGGIAAGTALIARDRGEVQPAFLMPLYATLDDRHTTQSSHEITDPRTWNRRDSLRAWKAYLGQSNDGSVSCYAAPARANDLSRLPPTFMMVGELDLLRDENLEYASRLVRASVPTEFHLYPGAYHAFEVLAPTARISREAIDARDRALRRALHSSPQHLGGSCKGPTRA